MVIKWLLVVIAVSHYNGKPYSEIEIKGFTFKENCVIVKSHIESTTDKMIDVECIELKKWDRDSK